MTRAGVPLLALLLALAAPAARAAIDFYSLPRIHRIALPAAGSDTLLLATVAGILTIDRDGKVEKLAFEGLDITALAADPRDRRRLYASGRRSREENLGVLVSSDGARSWETLAPGARQPARFNAIAPSRAVDGLLFASYGGLQMSRDAGLSWQFLFRGPWDLFSLAASARDPSTLYAASRGGLMRSEDGGQHWRLALDVPNAATAVTVTASGEVYAFVAGRGLLRSIEPVLAWRTVNNRLGEQMLVQILPDPQDPRHLFALNHFGRVLESGDRGLSWTAFGGEREPQSEAAQRGERLFRANCRRCHGERGVGETPDDQALVDPDYLRAPALDDSSHGYHHSDEDMRKTILEGSEREPRMRSFKDRLSEAEIGDLIAYIKSLWGPRALACQGKRHMAPECRR